MEAAAGVAATRGGSLPMPSSSSRKEWRAVSEHHTGRNTGDEEFERSKLSQSDERTIYEHGREPVDVDFCSVTVDGSSDNDILQQRLCSVGKQREELQQMEIELRAQIIARSEIMEMQNSFDARIKDHANAATKLQEQLHQSEHTIRELERKMEEKDRELHAIKLDNEAAWAKEDLLREQNKELATFRRERDHSEAERAQHIKQIHDFQEHIQEKERQLMELQEQHRVAQETILYKDEQLREAQAWITRVQEVDALQSNTNHSLQAELRERTDQYNQLWMGCQRQFAEMERLHLHTVQQLQLELAEARERSSSYADESHRTNSKDISQFGQNNGNHIDVNGSSTTSGNMSVLNGNADNVQSFASSGNTSTQAEHVPGVPMAPSSLLGMPTYLPPGQVTALHSFLMHQQGVPQSVPSHVPQSHVGHFHSMPAVSSMQQWQNQQAIPENSQIPSSNQIPPSQADQGIGRSDAKYEYEVPANGQSLRPDYLDVHISQAAETDSMMSSSTGKAQVLEPIDGNYLVGSKSEQNLQQISSQFRDALRLDTLEKKSESKDQNIRSLNNHGPDSQLLTADQKGSAAGVSSSDTSRHSINASEASVNNGTGKVLPEGLMSTGTVGRSSGTALLDERSLLACIVRTIPAGGKIRISSTLPNRLGKMLAPLHWHDYKKKYGKLDDFVASHPELFVIEGDYIELREGAQKMVAATAAVAKVAAAAVAPSPYSSFLAVTPMAQSHRLKKVPSADANHVKPEKTVFKEYAGDDSSQFSAVQNQHQNGVCFGMGESLSNIKILSKAKDHNELNGTSFDRSKGSTQGRSNSNYVGKQQSRNTGASLTSRR